MIGATMNKSKNPYEDILNTPYPFSDEDTTRHPRMSLEDRAKIFAPFAALKGHEEAIRAKEKIVVSKMELSEESKNYLDQQLDKIKAMLTEGDHPIVTVIYFQKEPGQQKEQQEEKGEYLQVTGMVAKFNSDAKVLQIVERKIPLGLICDISGEMDDGDRITCPHRPSKPSH